LDLLRRLGVSSGAALLMVDALRVEWAKDKQPNRDDD
jgi:hypothetical protein